MSAGGTEQSWVCSGPSAKLNDETGITPTTVKGKALDAIVPPTMPRSAP